MLKCRKNSNDAVYVEDVAQCLYRFGAERISGTYYIESEEAGQWKKRGLSFFVAMETSGQ
ncbi:hypothetical protein GCM10020331_078850 [Ectobacillus funiculus]